MKTEAQINESIKDIEGQITDCQQRERQLLQQAQHNQAGLNQAVAENTSVFNKLQGQLEAYKAMLECAVEVAPTTDSPS